MAEERAPSGQRMNPYKQLKLTIGGKPWTRAIVPEGRSEAEFFAPGIENYLTLNEISVSASSEYSPALKALIDKMKSSTPGKAFSAIRKGSSLVGGALNARGGDEEGRELSDRDRAGILSNMTLMPPNVRYQTSLMYLPAWDETKAVGIESFSFDFHIGMAGAWDARTEVYNPVIALMTINVPYKSGSTRLHGPLPSRAYVYGHLGERLSGIATRVARDTLAGADAANSDEDRYSFEQQFDRELGGIEQSMKNLVMGYRGIATMEIGRIKLPPFSVGDTSYTFSTETDDNGFPIHGTITWNKIETIEVANRSLDVFKLYDQNAIETTGAAGGGIHGEE